jgi:hypothetical protein
MRPKVRGNGVDGWGGADISTRLRQMAVNIVRRSARSTFPEFRQGVGRALFCEYRFVSEVRLRGRLAG